MKMVELPEGVQVTDSAYRSTAVIIQDWIRLSESDVNYLGLLVSLSACVRGDGRRQLSTDEVALMEPEIRYPLHDDVKLIIRNCLRLSPETQTFEWVAPWQQS